MQKSIKIYLSFVLIGLSVVLLTSCVDDGDDSVFVGKWEVSNEGFIKMWYTFNQDGTGDMSFDIFGSISWETVDEGVFRWVLDGFASEGGDYFEYTVDANTLTLLRRYDGVLMTHTRISAINPADSPLIGRWRLHTPQEVLFDNPLGILDDTDFVDVVFTADGTNYNIFGLFFTWEATDGILYMHSDTFDDSNSFEYSVVGDTLIMRSDDEQELTLTRVD